MLALAAWTVFCLSFGLIVAAASDKVETLGGVLAGFAISGVLWSIGIGLWLGVGAVL